MFTIDEPTAEAIRRAVEDRGELAGVAEGSRHLSPCAAPGRRQPIIDNGFYHEGGVGAPAAAES